jgi:ATP-dependent Lon protease
MVAPDIFPERGTTVPEELPVLPLRETVVFPGAVAPVLVGHERSLELVNAALQGDRLIAVCAQRNPERVPPDPTDLYTVGTMALIHDVGRVAEHTYRLALQGLERIRTRQFVRTEPYFVARVTPAPERFDRGTELEALTRTVSDLFVQLVALTNESSDEIGAAMRKMIDPHLAYMIASSVPLPASVRQQILEMDTATAKLRRLVGLLQHEVAVREMMEQVTARTSAELSKVQREHILRKQMETIQKELGEDDPARGEVRELRDEIAARALPEEAFREAMREIEHLERTPSISPEYGVIRTYLDWMIKLPWGTHTAGVIDVARARDVLDEDHAGLVSVKERILEYLAVRRLREQRHEELAKRKAKTGRTEPILCLVGPPGVGKTSLGRSIARAMGRAFVHQSLGGVHDEAEIRGHRRTYVGAMPGRVMQAIARAGCEDPVVVLDEIDKIHAGVQGDPSAALLELLDPAQDSEFVDTYLGVPFDLSRVVFVCTANTTETIAPPLLDRMEILELPGYTEREKVRIASRFLVPQQRAANGLRDGEATLSESAIVEMIRGHTREAGVRNLERQIATALRKTARRLIEGVEAPVHLDASSLPELLGAPKFVDEVAERIDRPGVATGLSWTPAGGAILFVEATMLRGREEHISLTGMLGDVMRESAAAALTYLRANAESLGLSPHEMRERRAVHVHVPGGAIPKDGPSAGVTILTALASSALGKPIRGDVGMTGEITLRGKVLRVGGLKEKVLAAHRAGLRMLVLPRRNEGDLDEVPADVRAAFEIVLVDSVDEVLAAAFASPTLIEAERPLRP